MAIVTGKLYLTKAHSSSNIGQTARIELHGVTSVIVYGTENEPSTVTNAASLTPASEALTEDSYYPFDTLPKYIAFVGTVTTINVAGYDLTYVKDLV
ncbi:MAG: hypothetical protein PF485_05675 [Bacteroidales bacterium]|jgi:hypothetical protein|nr:hypothetical protein [Bacteroidales bacterium]